MVACPHYADLQARWKQLAIAAAGVTPTKLPLEPRPSEVRALRDDLETLAHHVDALVESYGRYLAANATRPVDQSVFKDQLLGALEGNATFEIDETADRIREDILEAAE